MSTVWRLRSNCSYWCTFNVIFFCISFQVKNENESGSESETEDTTEKDKKTSGDKNKKKNAAPAPAAKIKPPAKKRVKVWIS